MAFRAASRSPGDCTRAMREAFSSLSSLMMVSLLSVSMPFRLRGACARAIRFRMAWAYYTPHWRNATRARARNT